MKPILTVCLLIGASLAPWTAQPEEISPGESITGDLGAFPDDAAPRPVKSYRLSDAAKGELTIRLESHDINAFLRVLDADGRIVAEDDDSGVEQDALLVVDGESVAVIQVWAKSRHGGAFRLTVESGAPSPLNRVEQLEASARWRIRASERALARGDRAAASLHEITLGNYQQALGRLDEAQAAFERVVSLAKELGHDRTEAAGFGNLGGVYLQRGDLARARELTEQWLEMARRIEDREKELKALARLGNIYLNLGQYPSARDRYQELLALAREDMNLELVSAALGNLGAVHWYLGELSVAEKRFAEAKDIARDRGDRGTELSMLQNLATLSFGRGDLETARRSLEEVLAFNEQQGDPEEIAETLSTLGIVHLTAGSFARARECQERCLRLAREVGDVSTQANALGNLGNIALYSGDFPRARKCFQDALALAREMGEARSVALWIGNLGVVNRSLGNHREARRQFEANLEGMRRVGDRMGEVSALANLGLVLAEMGSFDEARPLFEQSLSLAKEQGNPSAQAKALGHLAFLDVKLGRFGPARQYLEQKRALAKEIGDFILEAETLGRLAQVLIELDQFSEGQSLARESLALHTRMGAGNESLEALEALAVASFALGEIDAAAETLDKAEEALDSLSSRNLDPSEMSGLRSAYTALGFVAQDLAASRRDAVLDDPEALRSALTQGLEAAGRWKGRALLEGIAEHRSGARSAEAIALRQERREALSARSSLLERAYELTQSQGSVDQIDSLRQQARELLTQAESLADRLEKVSPQDAALDAPTGASAEVLRALLDADSLLIEYVAGLESLRAYVLTQERFELVDLGDRREIALQVESFVSGISNLDSLADVASVATSGRALFDRLLTPLLADEADGDRSLIVVPSAELSALPFEALVASTPESPESFEELEFVLDRFEVTYSPSSPVLLELNRADPASVNGPILVLADPVYPSELKGAGSESASRLSAMTVSLNRLPGTRLEALDISSVLSKDSEALEGLEDQRSAYRRRDRFELALGDQANRERLEGDLRRYTAIHLACHGFVDSENPDGTGIALSPGENDDGFFTIGDALELDLDCALVVLSACQTARGRLRGGEGVESLARAFLYSGSRGVIASLWPVDDQAASRTMADFYVRWLGEGAQPPEALRLAKRSLRLGEAEPGTLRGVKRRSGSKKIVDAGHPFYWAPFIHIGLASDR